MRIKSEWGIHVRLWLTYRKKVEAYELFAKKYRAPRHIPVILHNLSN